MEINPANDFIYNNLGNLLENLRRYEEAEKAYRQAISLDSKFIPAHGNLSNLLRNVGRPEEALEVIKGALEIDPEDFYVNIWAASIHRSVGNIDEAKMYAEKSRLLIQENNENYWCDLACIECIIGNEDLALQHLTKSAKEDKLDRSWAWEDPDLQWIRGDPRFIEIVGPKPEK